MAEYMLSVMKDERARTVDRIDAAKWLADRGFGRAVQALEVDVSAYPYLDPEFLAMEDLLTLRAMVRRYRPDVDELTASDELRVGSGSPSVARYRDRDVHLSRGRQRFSGRCAATIPSSRSAYGSRSGS
jgi:hypothetical protein